MIILFCLLFNQRLRSKASTFIYGQSKCSKLIIQFAVVFLYSAKVSYNFERITSCCVNGDRLLPVLLKDIQIFETKSCCTMMWNISGNNSLWMNTQVWDLHDHTCLLTVRPKAHKIRGDLAGECYNHTWKLSVKNCH